MTSASAPQAGPRPERLPAGYRWRPATTADVDAIHGLVAAYERALHGLAMTGADRITAELALPGLRAEDDTLLVYDGTGAPAGYGWVNGRRARVHVHPGHRGRGLGGALLAWTETRARRAGSDRLAQTVADGDGAATALLRAGGYSRLVTEWLLEIALPGGPELPGPPAGITVRPFRHGDEQAAYRLTEDAFDEWQPRRKSYAEWARGTVERATFLPAASPLAFAGGELVGAVLSLDVPGHDEGYVERVAVRRDHRDRGIARTLLHETFRTFHRRGRPVCTLWTHSGTGALSLYERLGMTVRRSSTVYGKPLVTG
ncbi:GNAT family N-acetyltransferase [Streptomyces barringtoniae]|uniref:GNAT family N-acetyltransferase n=1 Tax=Streptomyces barringtoniae TaxID=2892029 RepID=UPI001E2A00B8|nr:GNAT family N-acetyltransferase [Streptomyces barringtoniae]MCC5474859.1 GNAT family N-acetyltransferase [Streptomyces barringtoniae]